MNEFVETGRRIKAARELRGISSAAKLAEFLDEPNYRTSKLSQMEAGRKPLRAPEREFIAARLGLPVTFFTAPTEALGDLSDETARVAEVPSAFSPRPEAPFETFDQMGRQLADASHPPQPASSPGGERSPRRRRA